MSTKNYILGLDIGTTSIGWALVDFKNEVIIDRGVRIFTVAENPKDGSSLAAPRREKRTSRRTIRRRAGRMKAVRQLLIDNKIITENDLKAMYPVETKKNKIDDPWELRYRGLSEKLDNREWARVLIHIAKRRGYPGYVDEKQENQLEIEPKTKSKKSDESNDPEKDKAKLKSGVRVNHQLLAKYETIGAMFYKDEKHKDRKRNAKGDYSHSISQKDLSEEINKLFAKQKEFGNPHTTDEMLKKYLYIFNYKKHYDENENISNMIGNCLFELNEKRAPACSLAVAKFGLLQTLSNRISIKIPNGYRELIKEEKENIINVAVSRSSLKYEDIAKIIGLNKEDLRFDKKALIIEDKKSKKSKEDGDTKNKEKGTNITATVQGSSKFATYNKLKAILIKHNINTDIELVDKVIRILTYYKHPDKRKTEFEAINSIRNKPLLIAELLEENANKTSNLSLKAINNILPYLYEKNYADACEAFGYKFTDSNLSEQNITNPVVKRAFTQLKKLVKAIIKKQHGNPTSINIELARDMNKTKEDRDKIKELQEENYFKREKNKQEFFGQFKRWPKKDELLKFELYKQQNSKCIYSGKVIDLTKLMTDPKYAEVDHIIPESISFDNSKSNLVLCLIDQNQDKEQRTPYIWFSQDKTDDDWKEFVGRCMNMERELGENKIKKLFDKRSLSEIAEDAKERHLNDTKYIARVVKHYLEKNVKFADDPEYTDDQSKRRKVLTVSGGITAYLRRYWGLERLKYREIIIDDKKPEDNKIKMPKFRESDINHAVDAIVVACATATMIKRISDYTGQYGVAGLYKEVEETDKRTGEKRRIRKALKTPWGDHDSFRHEVKALLSDPTRIKEQQNAEQPVEKKKGRKAKSTEAVEKHKSPEELLQKYGLLDKYKSANANIKPVFVSRMPTRSISGALHKETIMSKEGDAIYTKKSPAELTKGDLNKLTFYYDNENKIYKDKALYEHIVEWLDTKKEVLYTKWPDKYKEEDTQLPKKILRHPVHRSEIKSLRIKDPAKSFVIVPRGILIHDDTKRVGVAENANMIRIDIFNKNGKYFVIPIYMKDINKPLPNLAIIQGKDEQDWEPVDNSEFLFSLYPNDIIDINGDKFYYISAHRGTGNIAIESHDSYSNISGKGLKTEKEIKKYNVDILGNLQEVKQETRLPLNLK